MRRPLLVVTATATVLVAAATIWTGLAFRWILRPDIDPQRPTDVTYLLASPGGTEVVLRGLEKNFSSSVLVVSAPAELRAYPEYAELCAAGTSRGREVICTNPEPPTTQGEARVVSQLARARGWHSITVVTHRSHVSRSRMLMERCFPGEVRMFSVEAEGRREKLRALAYETGAYLKAQLLRGC